MFKGNMGGFGGNMGNMQQMIRQAQKMQAEIEQKNAKADEELKSTTLTGTSGGGMVEVDITGDKKVIAVRINPEVVDPSDIEMLEDLIVSAINEAITKSNELEKSLKGNPMLGI